MKGDYVIETRPLAELRDFICANHYAKGCANTATERFGLIKSGKLVGAALWMPPTKVCAQTVHPEWKMVLSLSRLALAESEPCNAESLFIGAMIRQIKRARRWVALVTFADQSQGHNGVIYKATNWTYVGLTKPEPRWVDRSGAQVSRKATKSRTKKQMEELGYRMDGKYSKHKFVMVLHSRPL